jgi:HTH-type transcriptional regulator / antitoxin HigA
MFNTIQIIKTEAQYDAALSRTQSLIRSEPSEGTAAFDELSILISLVETYESQHYPIVFAQNNTIENPIEAIKFQIQVLGLTDEQVDKLFGSAIRKSAILTGQKKLSLAMIRRLHEHLKIPAETLIATY